MKKPIIGIPCDVKQIGLFPFHAAGDKYVKAAADGAGGIALLIPSLADAEQIEALLSIVDGVLLPGSPSNVEPHHYEGIASREGTLHDPLRDATTLPLIKRILEEGIPLLGICRGFQEMNVVLGGQLHQHVQEVEGLNDHREADTDDVNIMYAASHCVHLCEGSWMAKWTSATEIQVNSIHQQGVKVLAPGLIAEAIAPDGLIEAFRVENSKAFAYGTQWHPEWKYWENKASMALFNAFGDACRLRMQTKSQ